MKRDAASYYHARMLRVLSYIDGHLDDELSPDVLSGIAAFSKHHFQRQFSHLFGISVHRYVRLARLKRASERLAYVQGEPVLSVALDSGYEGPEAFARAFRQQLDQSPSGFRENPDWSPWHAAFAPLHQARSKHMQRFTNDDVKLIDFPDPGGGDGASRRSRADRGHDKALHRVAARGGPGPNGQRDLQPVPQ